MSRKRARAEPQKRTSSLLWLTSTEGFEALTASGYTKLSDCPEVQTAANRITDLVSVMTIQLMTNTKDGDQRIKNELSRKIDINPNKYTTRKNWVSSVVRNILLDGKGNSIQIPHFVNGLLDDLEPMDMTTATIMDDPYGYHVMYNGRRYESDEVLHFTNNVNPQKPWKGSGYTVMLTDLASTLRQARATAKALMESPSPSLVLKVDSQIDQMQTVEGRAELSAQYLNTTENGKPWVIPADGLEVSTIKPLTINDLCIKDSITLDKRTAAAIFGVPPFLVGEGVYNKDEYNNFISTIVLPIARGIEQELTRKLLMSPDWYFRFNPRSLYSYSITDIAEVACNMADRAIIDRNEARDWLGWTPRDGLSELAILENYIPYSKIGDQNKLQESGGDKKSV